MNTSIYGRGAAQVAISLALLIGAPSFALAIAPSPSASSIAVSPATAEHAGAVTLSATLTKTSNGHGLNNEPVVFTLGGVIVGSTMTDSSGLATLSTTTPSSIAIGIYPTGVGASFAGDTNNAAVSGTASLTVTGVAQTITVTTAAPGSAAYASTFPVAASASSGLAVTITTSGGCSITGGVVTMTSGTTSCVVMYDQAGDSVYTAAPQVTSTTIAEKAISNPTLDITNTPVSYDGSAHSAAVTASGSPAGMVSNVMTGGASDQTNAGSYAVVADFTPTDADNYTTLTGVSVGSFVISKVNTVTTVSCPASATYTGSAVEPCTVSVTGPGGLSLTPTPGYSNNTATGTATASYTYAGDANYNGSSDSKDFAINDINAPVINPISDITTEATGPSGASVTYGAVTATDLTDGTIAATCAPVSGSTFPLGHTSVMCSATNSLSITGSGTGLSVIVRDTTPPVITLTGPSFISLALGDPYTELGATAADIVDGSDTVVPSGSVNTAVTGTYHITYNASDAAGNAATPVTRTVAVGLVPATLTVITTVNNTGGGTVGMFGAQVTDSATTQNAAGSESGTSISIVPGAYSVTQQLPGDYTSSMSPSCIGTALPGETITCTITDSYSPSYVYGGGNAPGFGGVVLGASTETPGVAPTPILVLGASTEQPGSTPTPTVTQTAPACVPFTGALRLGDNNNQVKTLQTFLNTELGTTIPVTGLFGTLTRAAVIQFQEKYTDEVLTYWNINKGTGFVGPMTIKKLNAIICK